MRVLKTIRTLYERARYGISKADSADYGMHLAKTSLRAMENLEHGVRFQRLQRFEAVSSSGSLAGTLADWNEAKAAFQKYINTVPNGSIAAMEQHQQGLQQGLFYLNRVQDYLWD
jgi:hypothetical protein